MNHHNSNSLYKKKICIFFIKISFCYIIIFLLSYIIKIKIYFLLFIFFIFFFILLLKYIQLHNKTPIFAYSEQLQIEYLNDNYNNIPITTAYKIR